MRICSFLPSATEIVYELGLQDQLFGVTHECDYPADAPKKPHVVRSVFEGTEPTSSEISRVISERLKEGLESTRSTRKCCSRPARSAADPGHMRGLSHLHSAGRRGQCQLRQKNQR